MQCETPETAGDSPPSGAAIATICAAFKNERLRLSTRFVPTALLLGNFVIGTSIVIAIIAAASCALLAWRLPAKLHTPAVDLKAWGGSVSQSPGVAAAARHRRADDRTVRDLHAAANSMQQARLVAAAPAQAGSAVALNTSALNIGQAIGSAVGSTLFVHAHYLAMGYVAVTVLIAALALIVRSR
jgi:hypothetical protein